MNKNKIVLLFSLCFIFLTACADTQSESSNVMSMNETDVEAAEAIPPPDNTEKEEVSDIKDEPEDENTEKQPRFSTPAALSDNLYDFQLSIDGTVYPLPMRYCDFESLGWIYGGDNTDTLSVNQYVARQQWEKDGISIDTKLANLSADTVAFSDSMVAGINIDRYMLKECNWKILLPGGIQWGVSNADDIKQAYGEPAFDYDGDTYYKMIYQDGYYREIDLYIYKDTNVLEQIDIENLQQ